MAPGPDRRVSVFQITIARISRTRLGTTLPQFYPTSYMLATDAEQRLSALLEAAQREPLMIQRRGRGIAVLLSPREYHRLRALNASEFQRFCDRVADGAAHAVSPKKSSPKFSRTISL